MLYYPVAARARSAVRPLARLCKAASSLLICLPFLPSTEGRPPTRDRPRPSDRPASRGSGRRCAEFLLIKPLPAGGRGLQVDGRARAREGTEGRGRAGGDRDIIGLTFSGRLTPHSLARSLPKRWTQLRTNACSAAAVSWSRALALVRSRKSPAPICLLHLRRPRGVANIDTTCGNICAI